MKLISHPFSPYGRKVKITALMKGVDGDIKAEQADTNKPVNEELRAQNPLSKIPVLILDSGQQMQEIGHLVPAVESAARQDPIG